VLKLSTSDGNRDIRLLPDIHWWWWWCIALLWN